MFSSCRHRQSVGFGGDEWAFTSADDELPAAAAWHHHHQQQQQQQAPRVMVTNQTTSSAHYCQVFTRQNVHIAQKCTRVKVTVQVKYAYLS